MSEKERAGAPYNVLFLCTGNSARSILAEAIMNRLGPPKFKAYSAGSQPKGEVNPHVIALLKSLELETDGLRSKSWEEFASPDAPKLDFVITVCANAANEACPIWPGRPIRGHWSVPDPAAADGSEAVMSQILSDACRLLQSHIKNFCALPVATLDRLSLEKRIENIGATPRDPNAEGNA